MFPYITTFAPHTLHQQEHPVVEQPLDKEINSMKDSDIDNNYNFNKTPMIQSLRRHTTNEDGLLISMYKFKSWNFLDNFLSRIIIIINNTI